MSQSQRPTMTAMLAKLEELERQATQGEWFQWAAMDVSSKRDDCVIFTPVHYRNAGDTVEDGERRSEANCAFVAALRNHVPALIAAARSASDLLAALKAWKELRDSDGADGRDAVEWIERVERQMNDAILKAEGVAS